MLYVDLILKPKVLTLCIARHRRGTARVAVSQVRGRPMVMLVLWTFRNGWRYPLVNIQKAIDHGHL